MFYLQLKFKKNLYVGSFWARTSLIKCSPLLSGHGHGHAFGLPIDFIMIYLCLANKCRQVSGFCLSLSKSDRFYATDLSLLNSQLNATLGSHQKHTLKIHL